MNVSLEQLSARADCRVSYSPQNPCCSVLNGPEKQGALKELHFSKDNSETCQMSGQERRKLNASASAVLVFSDPCRRRLPSSVSAR